ALHPYVEAGLDDSAEALRRWLWAQLVAMLAVGGLVGIGLFFVGVPSALALGIVAGMLEFIPYVGPIASAIPALLMASTQDLTTVWWTLGVLVLVQQAEGNILMPLLANRAVAIAPATAIFSVMAFGILFGPLGLLLGFPLTVVFDIAIRRLYVLDTLGETVEIMGEPAVQSTAMPEHAPVAAPTHAK
ncbi:MAG: AI-2E family transporter, partial [Proteobacteria bacterium]|nr:AI-2E family transporter [Pseudomonadota bacterium]